MREVEAEVKVSTVKFIRNPRKGKVIGKVSVTLMKREVPNGDIEALRQRFETEWKATVREIGLPVDME